MLLRIEPLRNELKSLESEAGVSEAKVRLLYNTFIHALKNLRMLYT